VLETASARCGGVILRGVNRYLVVVAVAALLAACETPQKKREEELAKNTFACQLNGQRFVVRFVESEARMLLPGAGERVTLYQIQPGNTGATVRYSNGSMELRGRGTELTLISDGQATPLRDCEPYAVLPPPSK
jgi:hypothetical protein